MLQLLGSRRALYFVLGFFVLESAWIALTSRFPMAFDEYFHYGVAQLHTETWSPFLTNVPDSASLYGAITRDPSFLFHYLISFPLRVIELFTGNMVWHVLILRFLNIGLALASLLVYAKLFKTLGVSQLATNIIILFVALIPVFPLMAGQITYDNLFFLLVAIVSLLAVKFAQQFMHAKTINADLLNWLLVAGLYTCFVKYAFLPAMAAIVLCIGSVLLRNKNATRAAYLSWWQKSSRVSKSWLAVALIIGAGFFAGSYGVNLVRYHTPVPDCDAVLTIDACKSYGPWNRDYNAVQRREDTSSIADVPPYINQWVRQMMRETFFLVGAKYDDQGIVVYRASQPLPTLIFAGWVLLFVGVLISALKAKYIWSRLDFRIIFSVLLLYGIVLFGRNLQFFLETGRPVAIHGRYILPFIIPAIGVLLIVGSQLTKKRLPRQLKIAAFIVTLALFLQGGITTYLVSSTDDWMWPQSQAAIKSTSAARDLLDPLIYR